MTADTPHVEFIDIDKTFDGETLVVAGLNLEVRHGEFLTLLGPSGSGKTTCLMMLAGFEDPTAGEIRLCRQPLTKVPPHRRNIGLVFQNYALFPHMTVRQNLAFPLEVRGVPRAERQRRIARILEMVQLGAFADRRPAELSGGQQQRVAVARALVFDPQLVLMDEPLGALDKQLRERMQLEIKHIHDTVGLTFVYVTHDQTEALTMSDRIAVFDDGRIQQVDRPDVLYDRPATSFVANFIGENNRLEARITGGDAVVCAAELADGRSVLATPVCADPASGKATLSIRPERVSLAPLAGEAINRVPARVLERLYFGDHERLRLALGGTTDFVVKVPFGVHAQELGADQEIDVYWRAADCRALDPVGR